jgi:hypothetical protein
MIRKVGVPIVRLGDGRAFLHGLAEVEGAFSRGRDGGNMEARDTPPPSVAAQTHTPRCACAALVPITAPILIDSVFFPDVTSVRERVARTQAVGSAAFVVRPISDPTQIGPSDRSNRRWRSKLAFKI